MATLKKINEDPRLRPFLSSLFDSETYTRNVIKEGRSEECFGNIVNCVEDINVEIKGYISQHKVHFFIFFSEFNIIFIRTI